MHKFEWNINDLACTRHIMAIVDYMFLRFLLNICELWVAHECRSRFCFFLDMKISGEVSKVFVCVCIWEDTMSKVHREGRTCLHEVRKQKQKPWLHDCLCVFQVKPFFFYSRVNFHLQVMRIFIEILALILASSCVRVTRFFMLISFYKHFNLNSIYTEDNFLLIFHRSHFSELIHLYSG